MNKVWLITAIAFAAGTVMVPAQAASGTTCAVSSLSTLAFVYDPSLSIPTDSIASMTLVCSRNGGPLGITISIDAGVSATSGGISPRQMRGISSGDLMTYNLYRDAGRSLILGQTNGIDTFIVSISGIPNNGNKTVPITLWGRVPALQPVGVGNYADSVVITVMP